MPYLIALAVVALVILAIVILGALGIGAATVMHSLILSKGGGGGAIPVPVPVGKWVIQYSQGCPPSLADQGDGTYAVTIPEAPGSIHYVVTSSPPIGATISMTFALEGTGTVIPVPGADTPPAQIRLYMQRQGDMMTGQGEYEFYRWWSIARVDITNPGEYTLTAPVDPAAWTSVYGRSGTDPFAGNLFQATLQNLGSAGFTFGGQSFAGHGDQAVGQVRFVLRSYQ